MGHSEKKSPFIIITCNIIFVNTLYLSKSEFDKLDPKVLISEKFLAWSLVKK